MRGSRGKAQSKDCLKTSILPQKSPPAPRPPHHPLRLRPRPHPTRRNPRSPGRRRQGSVAQEQSPLAPPPQRHRPGQRMLPHALQPPLFQREVPLRWLVRIVDQHQPRVIPQPLRLLDHRLLVLPHKPRPEERRHRGHQRHMVKNVPRRQHIDPARRSRHRSHRRQARKPLLSAPDRLVPPVWQHKIDRRRHRLAIHSQQLVRRAVPARRVRRHPKPLRNRLKVLQLLMDARLRPPPPSLMHKRPMRRVHQPDNPVVHIARQLRHQVRALVLRGKLRQLGNLRQPLAAHPPRTRLRHIHPAVPIPLHARKRRRIDLRRIQRIHLGQRGNLLALPSARLKLPPVVLALHRLPVEPSRRQRNPPVRTQVPHRKHLAILLPSQQQRHAQQQRRRRLPRPQPRRPQRRIPLPEDQLRHRRSRTPAALLHQRHASVQLQSA
jgi:hypothetical protein